MPKLKSHTGAKKRFRITKTGKIVYNKAYKRHILTKKNKARKRNLRKKDILSMAESAKIKPMLPY